MMTTGQQPSGSGAEFPDLPWTELKTIDEVEAWVDLYNRELQDWVSKKDATGQGVCFSLKHGGQIFMHTGEEAILLDVTPEAEWVAPVLAAATGVMASPSQIWALPTDTLTPLILGLNTLIESTRMVVRHNYKAKKSSWLR